MGLHIFTQQSLLEKPKLIAGLLVINASSWVYGFYLGAALQPTKLPYGL
jgi:hypothetical protein